MKSFFLLVLVFGMPFYPLTGQKLSPQKIKEVTEAIKMPSSDFSVNIVITESQIQPSKSPEAEKPVVDYPEDSEGLWNYIIQNPVLIAEPYLKLATILRKEEKYEASVEAINKGLQRMSDALNRDMSRLEVAEQASWLLAEVYEYQEILDLWNRITDTNPENSRAWSLYAFWEVLSGKLELANEHLNIAYEKDPRNPNLYVTAFSLTIYSGIQEMGNLGESERSTKVIDLMKSELLERAVTQHPDLECAVVTRLALLTVASFWETSFSNSEKFDLKGPVKLTLSDQARNIFAECRKYFTDRVKTYKTPILPLKLLMMDAAMNQMDKEAMTYYGMAMKADPKDNEVHRIMGFYYFPQYKLTELATCMEADLAIKPNSAGFEALARVWYEAHNTEKAIASLEEGRNYGLPLAIQELFEALFFCKNGEIQEGIDLFEKAESDILLEYFPDLEYYRGVFAVLGGDLKAGRENLKNVSDSSFYYEAAKKMLKILETEK